MSVKLPKKLIEKYCIREIERVITKHRFGQRLYFCYDDDDDKWVSYQYSIKKYGVVSMRKVILDFKVYFNILEPIDYKVVQQHPFVRDDGFRVITSIKNWLYAWLIYNQAPDWLEEKRRELGTCCVIFHEE